MYKSIETLEEEGSIVLVGTDVKNAQARSTTDSMNNSQFSVELTMTDEGTTKFADATRTAREKGESIAIYYDGAIISAPGVNSAIENGQAEITGNFSAAEACIHYPNRRPEDSAGRASFQDCRCTAWRRSNLYKYQGGAGWFCADRDLHDCGLLCIRCGSQLGAWAVCGTDDHPSGCV